MFIYRRFLKLLIGLFRKKKKRKGYQACMKGMYKCKNPSKYKGNPTQIRFLSSWERIVMCKLDDHPNVIWWQSEEIAIPYRSPVDNRIHRYFVDFICKIKDKDNIERVMMLEVKPKKQTIAPKKPSKISKSYITEAVTYGVNQAKWKAAKEYCADRGYEFVLITEDNIFGKIPINRF